MSGFVITLDAILALTIAGLLVTYSMDLVSSKEFRHEDLLVEYGYDFLTISEKTGAMDNISRGCLADVNGTFPCTIGLKELFAQTPDSICMEAEMYLQDGQLYYHADNYNDTQIGTKTGCLKRKYGEGDARPTMFVKVSRVIVENNKIRPVQLELWYKGWKD